MLDEPITLTGRLTDEDLLEIHRLRWRMEAWQRPGPRATLPLALVAASWFYVHDGSNRRWWILLVIVLIGCAPWLSRFYRRSLERWRLRSQQGKQEEATAVFTEDSVALSDETSGVRLAWKRLAVIVATPRGLLFVTPPREVWFYLPSWIFEGNFYRDEILSTAEARGVRIFRLE